MNIQKIGFQHKDLLGYISNRVQYLDVSTQRCLALKEVYRDYKRFMDRRGLSPLLYRQFRQDFHDILKVLPKSKYTKIYRSKNIWVISNIAITNKDEMLSLYQNFYN